MNMLGADIGLGKYFISWSIKWICCKQQMPCSVFI